MTNERWIALMGDDHLPLTKEEISEGWHHCPEWDSLLIGPGMDELEDFLDIESMQCMCTLRLPPGFKPRNFYEDTSQ